MARESFATIARRRLLGLGYIVVIFALILLSIAVYQKKFTTFVTVKLHTDHTGNQLLTDSDVKERGIIVGSVHEGEVDGRRRDRSPWRSTRAGEADPEQRLGADPAQDAVR